MPIRLFYPDISSMTFPFQGLRCPTAGSNEDQQLNLFINFAAKLTMIIFNIPVTLNESGNIGAVDSLYKG